MIVFLVENKADINAKNNRDETSCDAVENSGKRRITPNHSEYGAFPICLLQFSTIFQIVKIFGPF